MLAALYESWALPLAVILVVPMCLLSSIAGVWTSHAVWAMAGDINIFTQIGFVVLVGLACKNAILIVELRSRGATREKHGRRHSGRRQAAFAPVLMTSFAFILGVVPLVYSQGAAAGMRHTLGVAVFSGMIGVTLFGIFLTPVFFYVVEWVSETSLFNNPWMKRFHDVSLDVLTLRFVPRLAHEYWTTRPGKRPTGKPISLNGNVGTNGDAPLNRWSGPPSDDQGIQATPK